MAESRTFETLKLTKILLHSSKPSLAKLCRVYNGEGQREMNFYIQPAQAVILSSIALQERKLSSAEIDIMESLGDRLYSLEEGYVGKVTDEARTANYEFVW
ncbi:hypothetical protein ES703_73027 [subsurface metagenome]